MTQNRRKFARQPIQLSALVHPNRGRSWLCSIRDFCEDGMLLSGGRGARSWASTGTDAGAGDQRRQRALVLLTQKKQYEKQMVHLGNQRATVQE